MNVNPFSRGTERPWASVGLAGFRASIDRDAAVLLSLPLTSSRLKAERRNAEAGFRSSDNRRSGKGELCAPFVCWGTTTQSPKRISATASICPFNKREDSRI